MTGWLASARGQELTRLRLYARLAWRIPLRVESLATLARSKLGLLPPGIGEIRLRGGMRFAFRHNSDDIAAIVMVAVVEGYPRGPLMALPEGAVVLDLGGHIGSFAVWLHSLRPDLRILTLEPSADNYQLLLENLRRNGVSERVIPVLGAACNVDAWVRLRGNGNTDAWYVDPGSEGGPQENKVRAFRLASLLAEHELPRVDFIKMDIEGAEFDVLRDAPDIISQSRGIALEYHERIDGRVEHPDGEQILLRYFADLGFEVIRLGDQTLYAAQRSTGTPPLQIG